MNHQGIELVRNMKAEGIDWFVTRTEIARLPSEPSQTVSAIRVTLKTMQGDQAVEFEKTFQLHWEYSLEQMLAACLKEHLPWSTARQRYLAAHGNVPVRLQPNALECLPEAVHTALRKLADGPSSVLTWNAIHHIHPYDRGILWETIGTVVKNAFSKAQETGRPVLRRALATSVCQAVQEALKNCLYVQVEHARDGSGEPVVDGSGRPFQARTEEQRFALLTLLSGVELTDLEEWMYGWLGYVVEDSPAEAVAPVSSAKEPAAPAHPEGQAS